jgi:putative transposase
MIEAENAELTVKEQCESLGISRSAYYYKKKPMSKKDKTLLDRIDELYTKWPFFGARKIVVMLAIAYKIFVGRRKVGTMMKLLGLEAIRPKKHLSQPNKQHKVYPYRLRGLKIKRPNMVWSADITYIRLNGGKFIYLVAIIDWYSRRVLSFRLSRSLDTGFCRDALRAALKRFGKPEYFNTDQGSQFTEKKFVAILEKKKITISMDGRGRVFDNIFEERLWRSVKYEDVYIKCYETFYECEAGLSEYFRRFNNERPHQSLRNRTPKDVYENADLEEAA